MVLVLSAFFSAGCASLLVSVNDQIPAAEGIKLAAGADISILPVTLKEGIENEVTGTGYTADAFKEAVRNELAKELSSKGIKAVTAASAETNSITLQVTRLEKGIGFFRWFPLFGLGDSYLTVNATLVTAEGKREIIAEKNGQIQGMSQMSDQTKANIEYVATALASALSK
jgi:hypothetical protein